MDAKEMLTEEVTSIVDENCVLNDPPFILTNIDDHQNNINNEASKQNSNVALLNINLIESSSDMDIRVAHDSHCVRLDTDIEKIGSHRKADSTISLDELHSNSANLSAESETSESKSSPSVEDVNNTITMDPTTHNDGALIDQARAVVMVDVAGSSGTGTLTSHASQVDPLGLMAYRDDDCWSDTSASSSDDEVVVGPNSASEEDGGGVGLLDMDDDDADALGKRAWNTPKTKGELSIQDLPPLEELAVTVGDDVVMVQVGIVYQVVDTLVIVRALPGKPPLDSDTILFLEDRIVLGQVFETFGPVVMPLYSIRFNCVEALERHEVTNGVPVFYAPKAEEYTHYVFMAHLQAMRGSDASWEHNNEPPPQFIDYSDDEAEREAKQKKGSAKRNKRNNNTGNEEPEENKRNKGRRPSQEGRRNAKKPFPNDGEFQTDVWPPKDYRPRPPRIMSPPHTSTWHHTSRPAKSSQPPWRQAWPQQPSPAWNTHNSPPAHVVGPAGYHAPVGPPPGYLTQSSVSTQLSQLPPPGLPLPIGTRPTLHVPRGGIAPPGIAPPGIAPPGIAPPGIAPPRVAMPGVPGGIDTTRPPPMLSAHRPGWTQPRSQYSSAPPHYLTQPHNHTVLPPVSLQQQGGNTGYTMTQQFGGRPHFPPGPHRPTHVWNN